MSGANWLNEIELGIGNWAWGGDRIFWGSGSDDDAEQASRQAFTTSVQAGINLIDTAEVYGMGRAEHLLGQFMHETGDPVIVASKFMPFPWRLTKGSLRRALQGSLRRLGRDRVDLYQIHWPTPPVSIDTWMDAMADVVEAGLVRAVGVSNYSVAQMRQAHAALSKRGIPLASNQVLYNLLKRGPEETGLLAACRELDVRLIAYSPLAQGLLTGKYSPENPPAGFARRRQQTPLLARIQPLVDRMRSIGEAHEGKTPAQVALNWTICKGSLPIPGARNARQASQNAGATGWRLTADEVAALDEAAARV
jgi:aryl-alcohol dehydrogenase-like predicted oxidoreductase